MSLKKFIKIINMKNEKLNRKKIKKKLKRVHERKYKFPKVWKRECRGGKKSYKHDGRVHIFSFLFIE